MVRSQRQLAKAIGVAPSTVAKYLKRPDWPVPRRGPWNAKHVAKASAWRRGLQEDRSGKTEGDGGGGGDDRDRAITRIKVDTQLKFERMREARVKANRAEGGVIDRELHERAVVGVTRMFVHVGDELMESLPHELDGDPATNEAIIRKRWHDARQRIMGQVTVELDDVDDEIQQMVEGRARARGRRAVGTR